MDNLYNRTRGRHRHAYIVLKTLPLVSLCRQYICGNGQMGNNPPSIRRSYFTVYQRYNRPSFQDPKKRYKVFLPTTIVLSQYFRPPKNNLNPLTFPSVYQNSCQCDMIYIGMINRSILTRCKEHEIRIRLNQPSKSSPNPPIRLQL